VFVLKNPTVALTEIVTMVAYGAPMVRNFKAVHAFWAWVALSIYALR
jgi:hypothetical protein